MAKWGNGVGGSLFGRLRARPPANKKPQTSVCGFLFTLRGFRASKKRPWLVRVE